MQVAVNEILDGTVTGVMKFGAFVKLPTDETGLVHISEISNDYVEKVEDFLTKGDNVKVKVLSIEGGKIALSIKACTTAPTKKTFKAPVDFEKNESYKDLSFEDKLSKFLKESSEREQGIRTRENKRMNGQRRNKKM